MPVVDKTRFPSDTDNVFLGLEGWQRVDYVGQDVAPGMELARADNVTGAVTVCSAGGGNQVSVDIPGLVIVVQPILAPVYLKWHAVIQQTALETAGQNSQPGMFIYELLNNVWTLVTDSLHTMPSSTSNWGKYQTIADEWRIGSSVAAPRTFKAALALDRDTSSTAVIQSLNTAGLPSWLMAVSG